MSAASLCAASAARRSSSDCTPSSARSRMTALGPKPGRRMSATTLAGCLARRSSSFATLPVASSSRIFSAVLLPTFSMACSPLRSSAARSPAKAPTPCAAFS
ncbi:MAG TPA: hypothetical protein VGK52_10105 [Polyangia bacterium]